jgi:hypothetical protein
MFLATQIRYAVMSTSNVVDNIVDNTYIITVRVPCIFNI